MASIPEEPPSPDPHTCSPRPPRSTPSRPSSYFTYPVSYAVSGIMRRLNTDASLNTGATASPAHSSRGAGSLPAQLQATASSLSHSLANLVSSKHPATDSLYQPSYRLASPFQPPPLTPLTLRGYGEAMRAKGKLLSTALAEEIRLLFPPRLQLVNEWTLVYSLEQNGVSLGTLYKNAEDYLGERGGFVLVVRDGGGGVGPAQTVTPCPYTKCTGRSSAHTFPMHRAHPHLSMATANAFCGARTS